MIYGVSTRQANHVKKWCCFQILWDRFVKPHFKDQQLRVDMTRPNGSVVTINEKTNNGRFSAVFDLIQRGWNPVVNKQKSLMYAFQAHIINATKLAPADSNIVWYKLGASDNQETSTDDCR